MNGPSHKYKIMTSLIDNKLIRYCEDLTEEVAREIDAVMTIYLGTEWTDETHYIMAQGQSVKGPRTIYCETAKQIMRGAPSGEVVRDFKNFRIYLATIRYMQRQIYRRERLQDIQQYL